MTEFTINERLAVVETEMTGMKEDAAERKEIQEEMLDQLKQLNYTINRYQGFIGGVVFVVMALGTFLYKFWEPIWNLLSGHRSG